MFFKKPEFLELLITIKCAFRYNLSQIINRNKRMFIRNAESTDSSYNIENFGLSRHTQDKINSLLEPQEIYQFLFLLGQIIQSGPQTIQGIQNAYLQKKSLNYIRLILYLSTQGLDLSSPDFLQSVGEKKFINLTDLDLSNSNITHEELSNIVGLCPNLTSLNLSGCTQLVDTNDLSPLSRLTKLSLAECVNIVDLQSIGFLTELTDLNLTNLWKIRDGSSIASLTRLSTLNLSQCLQLENIDFLRSTTNILRLSLYAGLSITDFNPISSLNRLTFLELSKCNYIFDISFLQPLNRLTHLYLNECKWIRFTNALSSLTNLTTLHLHFCTNIYDFSFLNSLNRLTDFGYLGCHYSPPPQFLMNPFLAPPPVHRPPKRAKLALGG